MKKTPVNERPFVESYAEKSGLLKQTKSKHPLFKNKRLYYLTGAVTNDPYAELKFDLAEIYIKSKGDMVINPLKVNPVGTNWETAVATDIGIINQMKDAYVALLRLSRFMDENKVVFPTMCDIDPECRQFDSPGKRLEKAVAFDILPYVRFGDEWTKLLTDAIKEKETVDGKKS